MFGHLCRRSDLNGLLDGIGTVVGFKRRHEVFVRPILRLGSALQTLEVDCLPYLFIFLLGVGLLVLEVVYAYIKRLSAGDVTLISVGDALL